jgi:hypothetical protein
MCLLLSPRLEKRTGWYKGCHIAEGDGSRLVLRPCDDYLQVELAGGRNRSCVEMPPGIFMVSMTGVYSGATPDCMRHRPLYAQLVASVLRLLLLAYG